MLASRDSIGHEEVRILRGLPWPLRSSASLDSPLHCLRSTKGLPHPGDYF